MSFMTKTYITHKYITINSFVSPLIILSFENRTRTYWLVIL